MMITVITFYRFVTVTDPERLQGDLQSLLTSLSVRGTVIVATEGINGTVAGSDESIAQVKRWLTSDHRFHDIPFKISQAKETPFHRTRVKLKTEIVTMGVDSIDPAALTGTYVKPKDWNALISDPDVLVVDTRNDYEVSIGTFEGAVNPETKSFRDFPDFATELAASTTPPAKVAMFCTGGIRCEKSTAYLKSLGVDEVYHLEGGILRYLEEIPEEQSLWQGECFVFDTPLVRSDLDDTVFLYFCEIGVGPLRESRLIANGAALGHDVDAVDCVAEDYDMLNSRVHEVIVV